MIKNIRKTKKKMADFYYEGLSLKNEDNSFFEVAPLISTNLGYFPITGVYRSKDEKLTTIKTKDYFLNVVKDDHTLLQYVEDKEPIWKNLKELNIGDKIITLSGAQEIIEIIGANNGSVFDFRVDPIHAYFTNGILSHNSMIALSMMREPSIDLIVYFDSEGGGISNDFAQFLGIDSSKILYQPMNTMEELKIKMGLVIDIIEKNKSKKNVLMIIDSISMLTTERELDEKGGCYTPDTQISILKDGTIIAKTISEVIEGDLIRTHLGDWQPIEKVWKFSKEEKPELIEIETDDGDIVKLTPQHRLLVNRDNELQWVMAEDLKLSDELQKLKI